VKEKVIYMIAIFFDNNPQQLRIIKSISSNRWERR